MNETNNPTNLSDFPWPTSDPRVGALDTSMFPGSEKMPPEALGMRNDAVQGAYNSIDRLADSSEPAVRQLGETVKAAGVTLHAKADQLRETRDKWVEGMRCTVRTNPLVSVASAFALGAVIARITQGRRT